MATPNNKDATRVDGKYKLQLYKSGVIKFSRIEHFLFEWEQCKVREITGADGKRFFMSPNEIEEMKLQLLDTLNQFLACGVRNINSFFAPIKCLNQEYNDCPNISEEMLHKILKCWITLCNNCDLSAGIEFYHTNYRPLFAEALLICCTIVSNHRSIQLKKAALLTIQAFLQVHNETTSIDHSARKQVAECLHVCLPKLVSTTAKLFSPFDVKHESLGVLSIETLGRTLHLFMEDFDTTQSSDILTVKHFAALLNTTSNKEDKPKEDEILGLHLNKNSTEEKKAHFKKVTRSKEWLVAATKQIIPILENLSVLAGNDIVKVRYAVMGVCRNLLLHCSENMQPALPVLLEVMFTLKQDQDNHIKLESKLALEEFQSKNSLFVLDIAMEMLQNLLVKMPYIIRREESDQLTASVCLIYSLIDIITVEKLICCNFWEQLITVLLDLMNVDLHSQLLEKSCPGYNPFMMDQHQNIPVFNFKYFHQSSTINTNIKLLCNEFSNSKQFYAIADYLINTSTSSLNEVFIILSYMLQSVDFIQGEQSNTAIFVKLILDEVLQDRHFVLSTKMPLEPILNRPVKYRNMLADVSDFSDDDDTIRYSVSSFGNPDYQCPETTKEIKSNILHICLSCNVLGECARILGINFQQYIATSYNFILEKIGSDNINISNAAVIALSKTCNSSENFDFNAVMEQHADYIIYRINFYLKNEISCERTLDLLNSILLYSSMNILPYIERMVDSLINDTRITNEGRLSLKLDTLNQLLKTMERWMSTIRQPETSKNSHNLKPIDAIIARWTELSNATDDDLTEEIIERNSPLTLEDFTDANLQEEAMEEDDECENTEEVEIPRHITLLVTIVQGITHHISAKNLQNKIIVLEAINRAILLLRGYENQYLPLIHQLWLPFIELFNESDDLIWNRSFSMLITLADLAKDFILRRTVQSIVPKVNELLRKSTKCDKSFTNSLHYKVSQRYKLLKNLLENYGKLASDLNLGPRELDKVMDSTLEYLHSDAPIELQSMAVKLFNDIFAYDPSAVYGKLLFFSKQPNYEINCQKILCFNP